MIQMTMNETGKFVGPLFLTLQESKGQFGLIVIAETGQNIQTKFVPLVLYMRKEHQAIDW